MKTKTLTIDLRARKYNAVHETAAFEAIIKVARMANAFGIAIEATHKVFGGTTGRYVNLREIKKVLIMNHMLNYKAVEIIEDLFSIFGNSPSFDAFTLMSDEGQEKFGEAPQERSYVDVKIISSNATVAAAIRGQDLVGKGMLMQETQSDHLCPAEIDAEESFAVYKSIADEEHSPRIYNQAINTAHRWTYQFNHAALTFIRGQCKDLGLTLLEESATEIRETVNVH